MKPETVEIAKVMHRPMDSLSSAFHKTLMTTFGMTVISFLSSVATARILGPEERGLLSAALMIATLSAGIAQMGLANAYVYFYGAARRFNYYKLLVRSLLVVAGIALLVGLGGLVLSAKPRLTEVWYLILLLCAGTGMQLYFSFLSQLKADLGFYNNIRFAQVCANALLLIPIFYFYRQHISYQPLLVAQSLVAVGLVCAGLLWARRHRIWELTSAAASATLTAAVTGREVARYGLHQHGTVMLSLILLNFDKIVLMNRGSMEEYGYYAMAFTTSRLIGTIQEALSVALFARFAGKDIAELSAKVRTAFRITFVPLLVLAGIGAALAPWLIVWVYGSKFASMVLPFSILLFECVIGGASWTLAQRFTAAGRPGLVLVRQFVSVLPVFVAMPFLPAQNIYIYLALLMLSGAILRLSITLLMFPLSLKESMPQLLPTRQDIKTIMNIRFNQKR